MKNDNRAEGAMFGIAVILIIGFVFLILPVIVGWALAYLIHIISGEPEITDFWARWFLGMALIIVASLFKPDVTKNVTQNVTQKVIKRDKDYWFDDE